MGKNKMIAKSCPKCDQQVAVATKICKCGHTFFSAKSRLRASGLGSSVGGGSTRSSTVEISDGGRTGSSEGGRRRTGRVRRARPHFYDSQDYQRAPNKRRSVSQGSLEEERVRDRSKDSSKDSATAQRAARRRALKLRCPGPESRPQRGTAEAPPHPARLQRCATLLQEINRKMAAVTWSPD